MNQILLLILLSLSISSLSQTMETHTVYTHNEDTSFAGTVNWIVYQRIDSSRFMDDMPYLDASDQEGVSFDKEKLKPIVFYNFWFITCSPCVAEMPMYNSLADKYRDSISFIAITFDSQKDVNEFLESHNFGFNHFFMSRNTLENLHITHGYPTTIITFYDKIIYYKHGGIIPSSKYFGAVIQERKKQLESIFKELLIKLSTNEDN